MKITKGIKTIKEIALLQGHNLDDKAIKDIYEKVACDYISNILNKVKKVK